MGKTILKGKEVAGVLMAASPHPAPGSLHFGDWLLLETWALWTPWHKNTTFSKLTEDSFSLTIWGGSWKEQAGNGPILQAK